MTVSLTHSKVSTKPATANTEDIDATDWNAEHVITMSSGNVLGRTSSGDGAVEEITIGSLLAGGTIEGALTTTGNITVSKADAGLTLSSSSGNAFVQVDSISGQASDISFRTGTSLRWVLRGKDATAETGSNAGSDFAIYRYNDAGTYQDSPFTITRSTGNITIANDLTVSGTAKTTATTVGSLPSASSAGAGARSFVTDANATTFASIVAAGGSNGVPVYSDGTNWRIG